MFLVPLHTSQMRGGRDERKGESIIIKETRKRTKHET